MRLLQLGPVRLACCAAVFPLALASCGHLGARVTPGEPAASTTQVAVCKHFQAAAHVSLAAPPDPITGTSSGHHSHAVAMARYHACLARR